MGKQANKSFIRISMKYQVPAKMSDHRFQMVQIPIFVVFLVVCLFLFSLNYTIKDMHRKGRVKIFQDWCFSNQNLYLELLKEFWVTTLLVWPLIILQTQNWKFQWYNKGLDSRYLLTEWKYVAYLKFCTVTLSCLLAHWEYTI